MICWIGSNVKVKRKFNFTEHNRERERVGKATKQRRNEIRRKKADLNGSNSTHPKKERKQTKHRTRVIMTDIFP